MAEQIELFGDFDAHKLGAELSEQIEEADDILPVLGKFFAEMKGNPGCVRDDSYAFLQVVGLGTLSECFVWWMQDGSALFVGWKDAERIAIGVVPPDAEFAPLPYDPKGIPTLH